MARTIEETIAENKRLLSLAEAPVQIPEWPIGGSGLVSGGVSSSEVPVRRLAPPMGSVIDAAPVQQAALPVAQVASRSRTTESAPVENKPVAEKPQRAKPVDAAPSGEVPKTDTGKWSTAASQAMIAAGLALMKSAGKTYTSKHEATMSGLTNVAEAAGAANQTYQGIKAYESTAASKAAEDKSQADLRAAQAEAARGGMRTHEQDLELQKLKARSTGHSESYYAALASDKVQDNQRKNMDAIEKNAYNKAKAAFIAKPGIVWTNDGQLDMSGLNSPDTIRQFFDAVKKETVAGARTRRSLIGETLYNAILEEGGTVGDPQPSAGTEPRKLYKGKMVTRAEYDAMVARGE